MNYSQVKINEANTLAIDGIDKQIEKLQNMAKEYDEKYGKANRKIGEEIQKLLKKRNQAITGIKESAEDDDEERLMTRIEKKKIIADANISSEKKYNAFCLSISGYDIPKLETTLDNKKTELFKAKEKKKRLTDHIDKKVMDAEIDYLTKACTKCGDMIRKRKSYNKKFNKK